MKKLLLVVLCIVAAVCLWQVPSSSSAEPITDAQEIAQENLVTRFLVMGRDRAAGLCDSMFVVTLNETRRSASVLQIPRDTYANYTDRDYKKLNGALNVMGAEGVTRMLSEALGVPIAHFIVLDLDGLQSMVDAIGGVDVVLEREMAYTDPAQGLEIKLPKGAVHLDGQGAEQLVRYRAGYVNADLGRLDAQKLFLRAFAQKCKTVSVTQAMHLMESALTRVQTDLTLPEAIRLASVLRECDTDDIPMATLAGEPVQGVSGAWYYCICRAAACRMVNEYLCPAATLDIASFDTKGLFDRVENQSFHKIYTAPDFGGKSDAGG